MTKSMQVEIEICTSKSMIHLLCVVMKALCSSGCPFPLFFLSASRLTHIVLGVMRKWARVCVCVGVCKWEMRFMSISGLSTCECWEALSDPLSVRWENSWMKVVLERAATMWVKTGSFTDPRSTWTPSGYCALPSESRVCTCVHRAGRKLTVYVC